MAREIFISYRRDDDAGMALALHSHLTRVFTEDRVFMDVEDGIPAGHDFVEVLEQRVAECKIMLAVIGKAWLTAHDAGGNDRLGNPEDFVRIEIESAMTMGKVVIPVLINDTDMPRAAELPETMRAFARRQAVTITSKRLRADAEGIVRILQRELSEIAKLEAALQKAKQDAEKPAPKENDLRHTERPELDDEQPNPHPPGPRKSEQPTNPKEYNAFVGFSVLIFAVACLGVGNALVNFRAPENGWPELTKGAVFLLVAGSIMTLLVTKRAKAARIYKAKAAVHDTAGDTRGSVRDTAKPSETA